MAESKIYRFPAELSYARLGDAIVVWLRDRKKMVAEGVSAPNGYLVQAKAPKTWKKFVGMDAAQWGHDRPPHRVADLTPTASDTAAACRVAADETAHFLRDLAPA